jgi:hypothetical protein
VRLSMMKNILKRIYYTLTKESDGTHSIFEIDPFQFRITVIDCMIRNEKSRENKEKEGILENH